MRRTARSLFIAALLLAPGCAGTREALFDGTFDCLWEIGSDLFFDGDDLTEDDKYIAKRKGMSEDQYQDEKRQQERWRELRED